MCEDNERITLLYTKFVSGQISGEEFHKGMEQEYNSLKALRETNLEQVQNLIDTQNGLIKTLDRIWHLIYPPEVDWEYRDQVANHIEIEFNTLKKKLETALNALRSYQYGNTSPDLAEEIVKKLEE